MLTKLFGPERDLELGLLARTTCSSSDSQDTIDHTSTSTPVPERIQDRPQLLIGDGLLAPTTSSTSLPQNTVDHTPTSTPVPDRNKDRSQLIIGDALELFSKHLRGYN
jgi:hypothetical protein